MKNVLKFASVVFLVIAFASNLYAKGWVQDGTNWKYENDGEFLTSVGKNIDGKWYMFDADGNMITGLYHDDEKFYYFNSDGTPADKLTTSNGKKYNVTSKGEIKGITEDEFYDYKDSLSALYFNAGGSDAQMDDYLKQGIEQAKTYFKTLPLSRKAFKTLFKLKGYNDNIIDYVFKTSDINWKEQALKCAKDFYDKSQLNRVTMKELLTAEEFSDVEASYGTEMSFKNDTLSTGVGVKNKSVLLKDYLDRMSLVILGEKLSDIEAKKAQEKQSELAAAAAAAAAETTVAQAEPAGLYKINKKEKRTYYLNLVDDDAEKGKVKVKITLPVPEIDGPRAAEINALINQMVFGEVLKYLEYNYYESIHYDKSYSSGNVTISAQDVNSITLDFEGSINVPLKINLLSMQFERDMVKK